MLHLLAEKHKTKGIPRGMIGQALFLPIVSNRHVPSARHTKERPGQQPCQNTIQDCFVYTGALAALLSGKEEGPHPFSKRESVSPSGKPQIVFTRNARRRVACAATADRYGVCTCPDESDGTRHVESRLKRRALHIAQRRGWSVGRAFRYWNEGRRGVADELLGQTSPFNNARCEGAHDLLSKSDLYLRAGRYALHPSVFLQTTDCHLFESIVGVPDRLAGIPPPIGPTPLATDIAASPLP